MNTKELEAVRDRQFTVRAAESALARARAEPLEEACKTVREFYPRIDGPGWLEQDSKRAIARELAAAIRALAKGTL